MGNLVDLPNITPDSIVFGNKKPSNFDVKNYLNVRLDEGQTEKTITIRLLPMDLSTGNPFVKIHVHNVQVPKELARPGQKPFKDYICLSKTKDIDHEKFGHKCPFCEINKSAYEEAEKCKDPIARKSWIDTSLDNKAREAVILRCIERGKENEGVKFWKFKLRDDKTDPYNQIIKLYQMRRDEAAKAGVELNILDIYNGRDLNVTITAEGTSAPQIVDSSISTPLSKDEEQMKKWIYDEKKWQDVFTCKPYEYLSLISEMKVPYYDKDKGVWVDRAVYNAEHGIATPTENKAGAKEIDEKIKDVNTAIKQETAQAPAPTPAQTAESRASFAAAITVNDDDIPF